VLVMDCAKYFTSHPCITGTTLHLANKLWQPQWRRDYYERTSGTEHL